MYVRKHSLFHGEYRIPIIIPKNLRWTHDLHSKMIAF